MYHFHGVLARAKYVRIPGGYKVPERADHIYRGKNRPLCPFLSEEKFSFGMSTTSLGGYCSPSPIGYDQLCFQFTKQFIYELLISVQK